MEIKNLSHWDLETKENNYSISERKITDITPKNMETYRKR